MTKKTSNRYSREVRARAVRMVHEHAGEHASRWAAVESIAAKIGCKLHFNESYANGVPLQTYVSGTETAVITCNRCMRVTTLSVERLVQRLVRTGVGDGNTGCNVFAAAIKAPCRHCGAVRWTGEIRSLPYSARQRSPTG